jgi:hypothetical protein
LITFIFPSLLFEDLSLNALGLSEEQGRSGSRVA